MKKAIIVGATSGIGKGLAKLLVSHGYQTGITGRRANLLEELKSEAPTQYIISTFDITETDAIARNLTALVNELGGLDLLVISSGTGDKNDALDFEIEQRAIATNVSGFTAAADWGFNYFRQQKSGHLVGISSIAGLRGGKNAPAYNATKAYQFNYLEALRQKAGSLKMPIAVTDIRPGFVDTDMAKGDGQFWVAPVDKAARQIYYAIKKRKRVAYVTKRWVIFAFLLKWLPNALYERM